MMMRISAPAQPQTFMEEYDGPSSASSPSSSAPYCHHPYVQHAPAQNLSLVQCNRSFTGHTLDSWGKKAEVTANNVWHNLRTSPSVSSAAWGKMNLTAKPISGGRFEALYKQNFAIYPNENQVIENLVTVDQVMVPLGKIGSVNPVIMKEKSSEKFV